MDDNYEMQEQFQMPEMDFDIELEPLENQSLVMEQSKLIFPKVNLIIDKNGIKELSDPSNSLTKIKIIPANMTEKQTIGKGAAGLVKRAIYKHEGTETVVAIKEIVATQKQKRNQLINDLRTFLTGEMSKYLVEFYGCYYHAGVVKQVIQYMNLGSLRNIVNLVAQGKIIIDEYHLASIINSILLGLHHIHRVKHQIHRDIKPENILINDKGQVKISDFGVTKYIENTLGVANTFVDIGVYMSPQRIALNTGNKYNYKCDIWGIGLILYELATGKQIPYKRNTKESLFGLMQRIISENPPNLQSTNRSAQLKNFINACLQKVPESRATVQQLLNHPWITENAKKANMPEFTSMIRQLQQKN